MDAIILQLIQVVLALITLVSSYLVGAGATADVSTDTASTTQAVVTSVTATDAVGSNEGSDDDNNTSSTTAASGTDSSVASASITDNSSAGLAISGVTTIAANDAVTTVVSNPGTATAVGSAGRMLIGNQLLYPWGGDELIPFNAGTDMAAAWNSGKTDGLVNDNPWRADFLDAVKNYDVFRFMDWTLTNGSGVVNWSDRWLPDNQNNYNIPASGSDGKPSGLAYEWMIDLCNRVQMDCWITLPHRTDQSTDGHWTKTATLFHENLDPDLRLWIEYSNETWNFMCAWFPQACYASERGSAVGLEGDQYTRSFRYQPYAAARMWEAFEEVYGKDNPRLVKVLPGQSANPWITWLHFDTLNNATYNPTGIMPDVYAIAPYFEELTTASVDQAIAATAAQRAKLDEVAPADVQLVAYEGGEHTFTAEGNDNPITYELYLRYLNGLSEHLAAYVNYGFAGKAFGSMEYIGHNLTGNAWEWNAIEEFIASQGGKGAGAQ
jgi:uncharacterized protein YqcC (DUF446 family)